MFKFSTRYFSLFLLLFITEILIAVFVHDNFIRPYVGDFLVVILIYCFVKAWINAPVKATAIAVLLFAYTVEVLQYFQLVKRLGLQHSRLANIVIGNSFAWSDMIAYTLGILLVVLAERSNKILTPSSNSSRG
ncbi:DUF2809 domain-containing protein [uncultured Chitinophaga sp.]|jgi:Protein of unknown function (DUF2809).|uniref:ribosomal maturation YjgA family protein n=1 Tax=uncultured Chitinophaga sp. TaxID=339340 RepID=UPI002631A3C3|nr:DUF2809 domain-containing protein [uncultured Chitinophaga sp.]